MTYASLHDHDQVRNQSEGRTDKFSGKGSMVKRIMSGSVS